MKIIDMHSDTIGVLHNKSKEGVNLSLRKNNLHVDLEKMKTSDYMVQCFAMFIPFTLPNPFEECMNMIDRYYLELEKNKDIIMPAYSYNDILRNIEDKKMSSVLTIEEGGVTKGNLSFLRDFYRLGVRMITLTWNYKNGIGNPNFNYKKGERPNFQKPNTEDGLTEYGIEMIKEMERLGIIIDVSHLSDKGFYDVLENTKKPFVASHSNARSVCNNVRNLTDDMIKKLDERKGVMGINYCCDFISLEKDKTYVVDIVKHIKHIKSIASINCIGLGSDFDGIGNNLEMDDCSKLKLLENELLKEGFTNEEIEMIFYKNVLRLFKEVLV